MTPSYLDLEQLQLIHKVQNHTLPVINTLLLDITLNLPVIPIGWKLGIYNFLTSPSAAFLTNIKLTPVALIILLNLYPLISLAMVCLFGYLLVQLSILLISGLRHVIGKFQKVPPKVFLELTFPADTTKSAYATEELYRLFHTLSRQKSFWDHMLQRKKCYSLEIVSTRNEGIRYILTAESTASDTIQSCLRSYLPGIHIRVIDDYLDPYFQKDDGKAKCIGFEELKLAGHFALPLKTQTVLKEHDPISYLTGNMTKLMPHELVSFQIVATPVLSKTHGKYITEIQKLRKKIVKGEPLAPVLKKSQFATFTSLPVISVIFTVLKFSLIALHAILGFCLEMIAGFVNGPDSSGPLSPMILTNQQANREQILNPYEQELSTIVKGKIDQELFETSIRILVVTERSDEVSLRLNGLMASFGQLGSSHQSFATKHGLFSRGVGAGLQSFKERAISQQLMDPNPILSASELSDLFHFPYTDTTQTEGLVKVHSKELPAPLSVKNNPDFDVVFGKNTYGNSDIAIGLTDDDRSRHVYIIGQTGSGKTTIIFHMAKDDIEKGRGVAVIDPHGELAEDLLTTVPKKRINDCVYFRPLDLKYPIGINLLELSPNLKDDDLEQEKELVCESVISVFRRIFDKDENIDAHRIEYILRNAIYTAFSVPDATIFTVYNLLNDPKFRRSITNNLEDENLRNFWRNEFDRAGSFQIVKMVSGVTARIGRFLFSPTARRILEQPKSTINFDEILSSGKILICNLAESKLGEDTSQLLGTMIIAKLQQAAMRRARAIKGDRTPFYLFIDEFQNFARASFTKLLSGGRKFGLRITIVEQSTSQQSDRDVVNVILANTGTVICFRTAGPVDEDLMLGQFAPYVSAVDIVNLPRYRFYMKLSAVEPEEPFSGKTIPIVLDHDPKRVQKVIEASRNNFAIKYSKPVSKITGGVTPATHVTQVTHKSQNTAKKLKKKPASEGMLPEDVND